MTTAPCGKTSLVEGTALWYVYLVRCADKSLYCGITTNVQRRLAQHNGEQKGGARYTRSRRPVHLCVAAPCLDKAQALRLEHSVRTLRAHQKIAFLEEKKRAFLG